MKKKRPPTCHFNIRSALDHDIIVCSIQITPIWQVLLQSFNEKWVEFNEMQFISEYSTLSLLRYTLSNKKDLLKSILKFRSICIVYARNTVLLRIFSFVEGS